jgi:enoyl-CoA hydratase
MNRGFGLPVEEGLLVERDAFQAAFGSEDAREGVAAFIEKRPPDFKGR